MISILSMSRLLVGSSSSRVSGSFSSMPARNRRVFSPPLSPSNGRKREIPFKCQAWRTAWVRSSIFQSLSSRAKCSSAVSPFRMAWSAVRHQGGFSATVIACQRGLFSGIDNQIEVGKQNFLIGMGIAKVFDNDTHKITVFRVDNIGVCTTHFQLL